MRQNTGILYILTYKCASRHSGVQFFHISTSKSGPRPSVFLRFWLQNVLLATAACNFSTSELQKVLRDRQFFTILTQNVLLATAACNFSTSQLQKVVRARQFFNILTLKSASRYSGVQFFHIATSKSGPPMRCFVHFWLEDVLLATAACHFSTSQLQKVVRARQFFNILTLKCASRYSGVQFFHIATSKSGPPMRCFVHFWLEDVLLATAACDFSTSQLQKVVRTCSVLYILTSKCASRYSGVRFLHIATSKSGPSLKDPVFYN